MEDKDNQILALLNQGCSYRDIAEKLEVSTRRIAEIKKEWFPPETASDNGFMKPENAGTAFIGENAQENNLPGNQDQTNFSQKPRTMDGFNNEESRKQGIQEIDFAKVEIRKAELNHELALKKLEIELHENNLSFEREKWRNEQDRIRAEARREEAVEDKAIRDLQFLSKKLFEKCKERDWFYDEAVDYYHAVVNLIEKIERFCYIRNNDSEEYFYLDALHLVEKTFDDFTEDWEDEDESLLFELPDELKASLDDTEFE
jgi:hypothetical protein